LSENVERNLESILVLFQKRKPKPSSNDKIEESTFERVKNLLKCPVCLEIYREPVYIKECMHRFCRQCIERIIRSQNNKGCPFCRIPLGSKRVLRNDYFTDDVISKVIPNLSDYIVKEEEREEKYFS